MASALEGEGMDKDDTVINSSTSEIHVKSIIWNNSNKYKEQNHIK